MSNEIKGEAQMRLTLPEAASEYFEALLRAQHAFGAVCPQHAIRISDDGRCAYCDLDEAAAREPLWVARIHAGIAAAKALA